MKESEPKILAEIPFGSKTLRIVEKQFKGGRVIDARLWFWHDASGCYCPTKSGLQMGVANWLALTDILRAACSD